MKKIREKTQISLSAYTVQMLKERTNLLLCWNFLIPANFIFLSCKFSRCLDWQTTYCLGYFLIWISKMQNMLLLLSFTVDCQWFKLVEEQWHNGKLKINSLISVLCCYFSSVYLYTQKKNVCTFEEETYWSVTVNDMLRSLLE